MLMIIMISVIMVMMMIIIPVEELKSRLKDWRVDIRLIHLIIMHQ